MSAGGDSARAGGIGFFGLLTILFVGLKLTGFIGWSWWAVTAPLWAPVALLIGLLLVWLVLFMLWRLVIEPILRRRA